MRIIHVCNSRHFVNLVLSPSLLNYSKKVQVQHQVFYGGTIENFESGENYSLISFYHVRSMDILKILKGFLSLISHWKQFRDAQLIVLHNPSILLPSLLVCKLLLKHKLIYYRHGIPWEGRVGMIRLLLRLNDIITVLLTWKVVSVSDSVRKKADFRMFGRYYTSIVISKGGFKGYPQQNVSTQAKDKESLVLGYIGRINAEKGFNEIIEIKNTLGDTYKILVAGWIDEKDIQLSYEYSEFLNRRDVEYLGEISDLKSFYNKIDVLLLFSKREGFPTVVVEASQHGIMTIGFRGVTGVCDAIREGQNGFLVGNISEAIKILSELTADDILKYQKSCCSYGEKYFCESIVAKDHMDFYLSL